MDHGEENKGDCEPQGAINDLFYIEDPGSDGEGETLFSHQKLVRRHRRAACPSRGGGSSPPLLLVFPRSSGGRAQRHCDLDSSGHTMQVLKDNIQEEEEEEEESDQSIEEWMILDGTMREEDTSIQLNLSYWNSSEDDSGDEDISEENKKSVNETWAVSEKDKSEAGRSLSCRYFSPDHSHICHICNRPGHLTKNCSLYKKSPTCVLCGVQGHIQRTCPGRPCITCGLPPHGLRACEIPPMWNQHCRRCGMTGHLSDACPDIWRQYHLTIKRAEAPLRPQTFQHLKPQRCRAYCYNCSKRGHYGHECVVRRMVSGTFPSLPYICHYDTMEDILQRFTLVQEKAKVQVRSSSRSGRTKTWPEKRRERWEVKRLRKEAQAIREGGLLARPHHHNSEEVCATNPFGKPLDGHWQSTSLLKKMWRDEGGGRGGRKSKDVEKWKNKGGMKRVDLFPHGDEDIGCENLLSPKQRVRHRRR